MAKQIRLKINGQEIAVAEGTLLIEAAKHVGAEIPHFCYHPRLKPDANCRMCLVEIEKMPKLQTSCSTPVSEGMVVWTQSDKVLEAQNGVMEFLLGNHPLDCPECDQGGECQLQDFGHQYSPMVGGFEETKRVFKKEYFGPLIEKEMNRCVSCLRCVRYCDEVIGSYALGSMNRGSMHEIGAFARQELECEYCGGCIQICPVGALTSRLSMYDTRTWQLKKTETVCNYCGDGCTLTLEAAKDKITRVGSEMGTGRNGGDLCARGFFGYGAINHPARLTRPILRMKDKSLEVTWDWALSKAAGGLKSIKEKYGPQSIGGVISAHCTNEEIYLFQKLMRDVIGSPHIDSAARYGYINALAGLHEVFGSARLIDYEDIAQADVLLVIGAALTETNPITGIQVKRAKSNHGVQLITVDATNAQRETYISHLPNLANQHLQIRFGTEGSAIIGLVKAILAFGAVSEAPGELLEKVKTQVDCISFKDIESTTGIGEAMYRDAARVYAEAGRGVMIVGRGVLRGGDGYRNMRKLAELSILAGQVGRKGVGILPLAMENNAFGAVEMGGVPEFLPGFQRPAETQRGHTIVEMVEAAARGEIKALYLVGENPLRAFPQKRVAEALAQVELLICQDIFPSETTDMAHILLPASSYAEKSGRFTNHEGEIQKVRQAIESQGNAKPDWMILSILSNKIKEENALPYFKRIGYKSPDEVWKEILMSLPPEWPHGTEKTILENISAYAERAVVRYGLQPVVAVNGEWDLQVGQHLYHAGKMSVYAQGLMELLDQEMVFIHPDDAERLNLEEGEIVELKSQTAEDAVRLPVRLSKKIGVGTLFVPEHFNASIKKLLPLEIDPVTHVPYGERGRVSLSKVLTSV
ncbi:MAG: NADH-quinone oxidoreductase subunit NuoG [Nitrospiria bacterium]